MAAYLGETAGAFFQDLSGRPGITAQVAGVANNIPLGPSDFTEPLNLAVLHFETIGLGSTRSALPAIFLISTRV